MTAHKHLKQRIRARMAKTGEAYAAARRQIIRSVEQESGASATRWHLPGNLPATTALRTLFAHAGMPAPHTHAPFSEAMLFGIAGGIGIGVFSFYYQKEDIATFFLAGRHKWHDDVTYLSDTLSLFGIQPVIQESAGAKVAEQQLRDTLDRDGPCIAWVDMAELPHRAMPSAWSGGGYHVITVYSVDDTNGTAQIGDLTDAPISITLADLARARARIKKQRHRLLALPQAGAVPDLATLVRSGLQRCREELLNPTLPGARNNARLDALRTWAERMDGGKDKERWELVFRPGPNLWRGLCAIYDFIEHYGSGGGLCRPLFADFLAEAATALHQPALAALGERYAQLGMEWSALADAALPDDVPALREAKELHIHKAELAHAGAAAEEMRAIWGRLRALEQQHSAPFPLSEADYATLRAQLRDRIVALYEGEVAAHAAIGGVLGIRD
jgi:Domain of unknown function (DUF4872)/Butirosin biosynthesis protein H, N-terminal